MNNNVLTPHVFKCIRSNILLFKWKRGFLNTSLPHGHSRDPFRFNMAPRWSMWHVNPDRFVAQHFRNHIHVFVSLKRNTPVGLWRLEASWQYFEYIVCDTWLKLSVSVIGLWRSPQDPSIHCGARPRPGWWCYGVRPDGGPARVWSHQVKKPWVKCLLFWLRKCDLPLLTTLSTICGCTVSLKCSQYCKEMDNIYCIFDRCGLKWKSRLRFSWQYYVLCGWNNPKYALLIDIA